MMQGLCTDVEAWDDLQAQGSSAPGVLPILTACPPACPGFAAPDSICTDQSSGLSLILAHLGPACPQPRMWGRFGGNPSRRDAAG